MSTSPRIWLTFFPAGLFFLINLSSCTSQEAKENWDLTLCWLRPSCQPQHQASRQRQRPPQKVQQHASSNKGPSKVYSAKNARVSSRASKTSGNPKQRKGNIPDRCAVSVKKTVLASKPRLTVSYTEPTTKADGSPLTNLAKTTIYKDFGKGLVKHKDIPATSPKGGGKVKEEVKLILGKRDSIEVRICITATDTNGREG